jgi:mannose-6-phosphate isomerase-like protein (cupin superfamily)
MLSEIKKADSAVEFETAERCHITEIANDPDDAQVSIARARVEPGVTTAWHRLNGISERYIIISGRGLVEVEDIDATPVTAGDVVRIAAGKAQRITNTGADELIFYAVCAPPFKQTSYVNLE